MARGGAHLRLQLVDASQVRSTWKGCTRGLWKGLGKGAADGTRGVCVGGPPPALHIGHREKGLALTDEEQLVRVGRVDQLRYGARSAAE